MDVAVLLDRSNLHGHHYGLTAMRQADIPVWIDHAPGIAHIKAIVIDRRLMIGGSYKYTASAERRNVKDVTFTADGGVAERLLAEWNRRRASASLPG